MFNDLSVETRNVLVEMTIIPLGSNGQTGERIAEVMNLIDNSGLFYEHSHKITCIEGEWSAISPLIYTCYEYIKEHFPDGFLSISIR